MILNRRQTGRAADAAVVSLAALPFCVVRAALSLEGPRGGSAISLIVSILVRSGFRWSGGVAAVLIWAAAMFHNFTRRGLLVNPHVVRPFPAKRPAAPRRRPFGSRERSAAPVGHLRPTAAHDFREELAAEGGAR